MILPQSRLSRLTLASLATLLGAISAVHADPVLTSSSSASANSTAATPSDYVTPGYVNSYSGISNAAGNGNGYSFANSTGAYAVSSSAQGKADGSAFASFKTSRTNDTGVAQHYKLSFHIYGGSISTYTNASLEDGEWMKVGYKAAVKTKVGAGAEVTQFASGATLVTDHLGTTLTPLSPTPPVTNTVLLNASLSGSYYSWDNEFYTVDLGVIAAGESFDVIAEVENMAFADVGTYSFGGGGGYYGGYGCYYPTRGTDAASVNSVAECTAFKGGARSFYGDPMAIDGLGGTEGAVGPFGTPGPFGQLALTSTAVPGTNDLPEPAGLLLVGAGLAAAAAARRRKR